MPSRSSVVLKRLSPGVPGTKRHMNQHGKRLCAVRYRYDEPRRVSFTRDTTKLCPIMDSQPNHLLAMPKPERSIANVSFE